MGSINKHYHYIEANTDNGKTDATGTVLKINEQEREECDFNGIHLTQRGSRCGGQEYVDFKM